VRDYVECKIKIRNNIFAIFLTFFSTGARHGFCVENSIQRLLIYRPGISLRKQGSILLVSHALIGYLSYDMSEEMLIDCDN